MKSYKNYYHKYDSCYATVEDKCKAGVFITLDNQQIAFVRDFFGVKKGTKVLCTIIKESTDRLRPLATIDAVLDDLEMAA